MRLRKFAGLLAISCALLGNVMIKKSFSQIKITQGTNLNTVDQNFFLKGSGFEPIFQKYLNNHPNLGNWRQLSAAVDMTNGKVLLFRNQKREFVIWDEVAKKTVGTPQTFASIPNMPAGWTQVDFALRAEGTESAYLFHKTNYIKIQFLGSSFRVIKTQTAHALDFNLPPGVMAAVNLEGGQVLLFAGNRIHNYNLQTRSVGTLRAELNKTDVNAKTNQSAVHAAWRSALNSAGSQPPGQPGTTPVATGPGFHDNSNRALLKQWGLTPAFVSVENCLPQNVLLKFFNNKKEYCVLPKLGDANYRAGNYWVQNSIQDNDWTLGSKPQTPVAKGPNFDQINRAKLKEWGLTLTQTSPGDCLRSAKVLMTFFNNKKDYCVLPTSTYKPGMGFVQTSNDDTAWKQIAGKVPPPAQIPVSAPASPPPVVNDSGF